jgi:membrane-bound lytic murein transglycosylase D
LIKALLTFLIVSVFSHASLTFDTNADQQVEVLQSLDIDLTFINDKSLIKTEAQYKKQYKRSRFFKAMKDAYVFIPRVKEMIAAADVPQSILYLAMAESNFKTRAYSSKKASGMWQFMPYTGKLFGLKINKYVDERRDLIKSTAAAIDYLKRGHRKFGKWYLSALSYNCGMGRVARAIRRAGTDDLATLLDPKKKYLPAESRHYIRKIVALSLMAQDEDFMLKTEFDYLMNRGNAYSIATVKLPSGERLSRVAKILHMKLSELKKLNRHLKYDFIPSNKHGYDIYIPYIKLSAFKEDYQPKNLKQIYMVHTVKKGDTLASLGRKYHISYSVIKDFNGLKRNALSLKQKLIIPIDKKSGYAIDSYIVRKGDTLGGIARKFRLKLNRLRKLNSLTSNNIHIGDRLIVVD